jgi:hypothetical protein
MTRKPRKTKKMKLRRIAFNKAYVADFIEQAGDAPLGFALWCQHESSGRCCRASVKQRRRIRCRWKFFGLRDYRASGKIEIH